MNKTLDFPFQLKAISDAGTFEGYGSVFGVKDSYDEIVAPGAFADTLATQKAAGRLPALLWQHRSAEPAGVYTAMKEDNIGLWVEGQLALNTVRGAEAYQFMKMGAITGLSIGYMVREDSFDRVTNVVTLKKLDLYEVSLVTFPANDSARVQGVKAIESIATLRACEDYLRDAGMSRTEAKALLSRIKSLGQRDVDEGDLEHLKQRINLASARLLAA